MGDRFENQQANAYTKIVRDYPLSDHTEEAKARLTAMNRPVPEADPVAYARQKYEIENATDRSFMSKVWGPFAGHPYTGMAAKSGSPQMTGFRPQIPASVPAVAVGSTSGATGVTDVGAQIAADPNALNTNPEARANAPAADGGAAAAPAAPAATPHAITSSGLDLNAATE